MSTYFDTSGNIIRPRYVMGHSTMHVIREYATYDTIRTLCGHMVFSPTTFVLDERSHTPTDLCKTCERIAA